MTGKLILSAIIVVFVVFVIAGSIHFVGAGERGVVLQWQAVKGVECNDSEENCKVTVPPLREGFNWKTPFQDNVINIDVRTIKFPHEQIDSETGASIPQVVSASSPTSDQQEMLAEVLITYHLAGESTNLLYKTIGLDFESKILSPLIKTTTKIAISQFTAEEVMRQRGTVQDRIFEFLDKELYELDQCKGCIILESVQLTNVDPPDAYQSIVNAKAEARENAKRAEIELETNKMTALGVEIDAKGKANAEIALAEGDRDAKIIRANGEAEYIKMIEKACGCEFVDYLKIMQWDGKVPMVVGSEGTMQLVPLPTP